MLMLSSKRTPFIRLIALALVVFFIIPTNICATEMDNITSRASYYLTSYNTYTYNAALGKIRVYFHVTGVDYMDEIGVLDIKIYESTDNTNWTWVETYKQNTTSNMLGYNKIYHSGYIEYSGTLGRYYKAYVCIWAGKDGDGDTRYMWTDISKATLFAG